MTGMDNSLNGCAILRNQKRAGLTFQQRTNYPPHSNCHSLRLGTSLSTFSQLFPYTNLQLSVTIRLEGLPCLLAQGQLFQLLLCKENKTGNLHVFVLFFFCFTVVFAPSPIFVLVLLYKKKKKKLC